MTARLFIAFLLFISSFTFVLSADLEQDNILKLHVIYNEKIQEIMQRLSLSVYEEELDMQQMEELFNTASELYLTSLDLNQALPGISLTAPEKNIFENLSRKLQVEANNLGYMAKHNDKEGIQITYQRLRDTCVVCHELFRL